MCRIIKMFIVLKKDWCDCCVSSNNLDHLNFRWLWMLVVAQEFFPFFVPVLEPARYDFMTNNWVSSFHKIEATLIDLCLCMKRWMFYIPLLSLSISVHLTCDTGLCGRCKWHCCSGNMGILDWLICALLISVVFCRFIISVRHFEFLTIDAVQNELKFSEYLI